MDYSFIDKLLERYWQCATSLEEEEMLKAFFRQKEIPQRFEQYRSLFNYEDPQVAYDKVSSALKDMSDGLKQQAKEDSASRVDKTKSVQ